MKPFFILILCVSTFFSCKTIHTPLYDKDCPFRQLNFTSSTEKDSLKNTLKVNDTLVASLKADLNLLRESGKVGNNLVVTIDNLKTLSRTSTLDVTNEYFQLFNNKTTALCGLNDLLRSNKNLRSTENRDKAEKLLISLIEDLATFSDKKKALVQ